MLVRPSAFFAAAVFVIAAVQRSLQICDEPEHFGGTYGNHFGSFSSPDYPSAYPDNKKCVWMIKVRIGYRIRLQFNDFQVESCSRGAATCACDAVDVYDGQLSVSKKLGRFCGQDLPNVTYSSERFMRVELITDSGGMDGNGFSAFYVSISPDGVLYDADSNNEATATPSPGGTGGKSGSTVIIATVCVVVGVVLIVGLIIFLVVRKRANEESRQRPISTERALPTMSLDSRPSAPPITRQSRAVPKPHVSPASNDPPPPYSEAVLAPVNTPPPYDANFIS